MKRAILVSVASAVMLAVPVFAQEAPQRAPTEYNSDYDPSPEVAPGVYGRMSSPVTSKFRLSIGGYIKLDYVYNSENMGSPNTTGTVATLQNNGIPKTGSLAGRQDQSVFSVRQTRIWFKVDGPAFLGARTGALIETDFFGWNGSSAEASNMRIRHAYGTMDWANTQLLFGQYWDVFTPGSASTIDFGLGQTAGNPTNPRVPQIRLTQKINFDSDNWLKIIVAGQNAVQDNFDNTAATPTWGSKPSVAGQIMFNSNAMGVAPGFWGLGNNPFQIGVFGLYGNQEIYGNKHTVDSTGYGVYTFIPVLKSKDGRGRAMTASLEAQAYMAKNLSVSGATAPTALIGPTGNKDGVQGYGAWGQVIFYPTQNLGITAGYGMRGTKDYDTYAKNGVTNFQKTSNHFYTNVAYDINAAIRLATEYQYVSTRYGNNTPDPTTHITSDLGQANVYRFSMMYFF